MILIYVKEINQRVQYIFELVFKRILQADYKLTADPDTFSSYSGARFSYSGHPLGEELHFQTASLLFEEGVEKQHISVFEWEGIPVFYRISGKAEFPFDPFSMCFFLVTRYEEYLPFNADVHDRFPAEESLAFKNGFLDKPVVNLVISEIKESILKRYPDYKFPAISYRFRPTVDIDLAFADLEKGLMRSAGSFGKMLVKGNFHSINRRISTIRGKTPDPYDNFKYQREVFEEYGVHPVYFVLLGDYGKYDKNISHKSAKFKKLIKELSEYADIGIHPSYRSFDKPEMVGVETARLSEIIGVPVTKSRQHFLRLKFPGTFRTLTDANIRDDYSMGYASHIGYRAGTGSSYRYYDLQREALTELDIHPFAIMDTAIIDNLKLTQAEAINTVDRMIRQARKLNGTMTVIWHNYALSETGHYKGWQKVFEKIIKLAAE